MRNASTLNRAKSVTPTLPEPSHVEKKAIRFALAKRRARQPRVRSGVELKDNGVCTMGAPHSDQAGWQARLENVLGTRSQAFVNTEMLRLVNFLRRNGKVEPDEIDAVLATLDGAQPDNEIEAMLVVQMAIIHALTMRTAGNLNRSDNIPQQDSNALALSRLTRTFAQQIEALSKLRRRGEQKVKVEHVHVYHGGQAIVGNVRSPGGGLPSKSKEQPHALGYAPGATMPCADTERR